MKTIRAQARNFALEEQALLRDEATEPYDFRAAEPRILERLDAALVADDNARRTALAEIVAAANRDADRELSVARATYLAQVAELPLFFDYDPKQVLVLGARERIAFGKAHEPEVERSLRVDTENIIAQNAAFAERHRQKSALIDVLRPLDPRTVVDDVMRPAPE